jgi:HAD superfamily hydrolase (TIGR01509 family)
MSALAGAGRPRAVVFDLDGTLTDNMPLHQRAFDLFAARHGLPPISLEQRRRLDGKRNRDILPILFGREIDAPQLRRFSDEKESLYRELSLGRLLPLPGLRELLRLLASAGVPAAIATSAPPENVVHSLRELALEGAFAAVAKSEDLPRGKPFPDVFLAAAGALRLDARLCLAFEDAPLGVEAARAAGMTCVALTTSFSAEVFRAHPVAPDAVVRDYDDFLAGPGRDLFTPAAGEDGPR